VYSPFLLNFKSLLFNK